MSLWTRLAARRIAADPRGFSKHPAARVPSRAHWGRAVALALAAGVALSAVPARAQRVDPNTWHTDGIVYATARSGNLLYIGGQFGYVGPYTGGAGAVAIGGAPLAGFPRVHGTVNAIADDGSGGWFLGGNFDSVGSSPRANLAHVLPDFSVAAWAPDPNSAVSALAVNAGVVYVGGQFSTVGAQTRIGIAAVDGASGAVTSWNPTATGPGPWVTCLSVSGDGLTIYAGGYFTGIGGQPRQYLAAIDASTGSATGWNPNPTDVVFALLAAPNGNVYAGGQFTTIGGQTRNRLAAIDAASGIPTSWNPNADQPVAALMFSAGTVYCGGSFTTIGGQMRNHIAALSAGNALATSWDPNASSAVTALALGSGGSTIYVGGDFNSIGGQGRLRIAQLSLVSGAANGWDPKANDEVRALAVTASAVVIGGYFDSYGGLRRNNLAAFDATTGIATSWDPNANLWVKALAVSGSTIYVGGPFNDVGGSPRQSIAALDPAGVATAWNPGANAEVDAIAVSGTTVYIGGAFIQVGGAITRRHVAAIDVSGTVTSWNPNANGDVLALALSGSTIYMGGAFTTVNLQTRNHLAALDVGGSAPTSWDPNANGIVRALAVSGAVVHAGGDFSTIAAQSRNHLAAIDGSGVATGWNPNVDQTVRAIAEGSSVVYVGGDFHVVAGQGREAFAAIDASSGGVTDWSPSMPFGTGFGYALNVSGSTVYAGGLFSQMNGVSVRNLGAIDASLSITAVEPNQGGDGGVVTVVVSGTSFKPGASVVLSHSGQALITGAPVDVAGDGETITTSFDLTGRLDAGWDVVVTNPGGHADTLVSGFTIVHDAAPPLRVDVLGPTLIRQNRLTTFDVAILNPGNTDALRVPVWLTGIPTTATVQLGFPLTAAPHDPGEPDWGQVPLTQTNGGAQYVSLVIPRVPPGKTVRRVLISSPTNFSLGASLTAPWLDTFAFRACLHDGGVIQSGACMGAHLSVINAALTAAAGVQAVNGAGIWSKIAWECEGANTLTAAEAKGAQILNDLEQAELGGGAAASCGDLLRPIWQTAQRESVVTAVDPSGKFGPTGFGVGQQVSGAEPLVYSIQFENIGSADAQYVRIVDALDPLMVNLRTVSLGTISFGIDPSTGFPYHIEPPPGVTSYATRVGLAANLIVAVSIDFDRASGIVRWSFQSLDPATGEPPAFVGFLPPDATPPQGQGSVLLEVEPLPTLTTGASISNRATITFDTSDTTTVPWVNTIDNTPPASHVLDLPVGEDSTTFTVHWDALNTPSDLLDFTVYVSKDAGSFAPWRTATAATADTFQSQRGHTYAFYSRARDRSNNVEPDKTHGDTQTQAGTAVGPEVPLALVLEGVRPNPAFETIHTSFTLPGRAPGTLELLDVAGRRVVRRDLSALGAGRHTLDLAPSPRLRPGLYFLRLTHGGRTLRGRVALMR